MELQLRFIGVLLIVLALAHVAFPRYFDWRSDLQPLSLINRQMMYVHTLFVALMVLLMGLLCVTSADELTQTALGSKICLGLFIFWLTRFIIQFWGYSSELWRGKRFETVIHVVFSILWGYLSLLFFMVYCHSVGIFS